MNNFINNKPYSDELKDNFYFPSSALEVNNSLSNIMITKKGLYILYGFRGTGKTSIANFAVANLGKSWYYSEKDIINIKINSFKDEKDFYRQLLGVFANEFENILDKFQKDILEKFYDKDKINLKEKVFEEAEDWSYGKDLPESITGFSKTLNNNTNIGYNSLYEEKSEYIKNFSIIIGAMLDLIYSLDIFDMEIIDSGEYIETIIYRKSTKAGLGIKTPPNKLNIFARCGHDREKSLDDSNKHSFYKKLNITYELKKEKILDNLKVFNKFFKVNIILDEVDKINKNEILDFLNNNKSLYYDCDSTLILITDIGTKLYIENNCDYTFDTSYILLKSFSFIDFLVMGNHLGYEFNNFVSSLEKYFDSGHNVRQAIYNRDVEYRKDYKYPGFGIFKFLNSDFYNNLAPMYREIFSKFYIEVLRFILLVESLSEEDYDIFMEDFIRKNELDFLSVRIFFRRFKALVMNNNLEYRLSNMPYMHYGLDGKKSNKNIDELIYILEKIDKVCKDNYYLIWKDNRFVIEANTNFNVEYSINEYLRTKGIKYDDITKDLIDYFYKEDLNYNKNAIEYKFYKIDSYNEFISIIDKYFFRVFYIMLHDEKVENNMNLLNGAIIIYNNSYGMFEVYYTSGYPGLNSHRIHRSQSSINDIIKGFELISNTKKNGSKKGRIEYQDIFEHNSKLYDLFKADGNLIDCDKKQFIEIIIDDYERKSQISN